MSLEKLNNKLKKIGLDGKIEKSRAKNKRFVHIDSNGKRTNFGDPNAKTFFDGATQEKRKSYQARASKIKNKQGEYTYKKKGTANYLAYNLLW